MPKAKKVYSHKDVENEAQEFWDSNEVFSVTEDPNKEKFYCLSMFPYPSGSAHMGHVRNYVITDVIARQRRMTGHAVLHPMGWDSFGLPAENAALERNIEPDIWTSQNIKQMRTQLELLGLSIDWGRELATCDKEYYHQQQKLFVQFYNDGLIYKKESLL